MPSTSAHLPSPGANRPVLAPLVDPLESRLALSASVNVLGELFLTGSNGPDVIVVTPGPDLGQVTLSGVPGVQDGTVFDDVEAVFVDLRAGADTCTLTGTLLDSVGNPMPINVRGGSGADNVTLENDAGNTVVRGNGGNDNLTGGAADDRIYGGRGADTILGRGGNDTLQGRVGADTIAGGDGDDTLRGGPGNDFIYSNHDRDEAFGGRGNDSIFGGVGGNSLTGGRGADTFYGTPSEPTDFSAVDTPFNSLFMQGLPGTLPRQTFWDRHQLAYDSLGVLFNAELGFVDAVEKGYSAATQEYRNVRQTIFHMTQVQKQQAFNLLVAVTNSTSPVWLADPAAVTAQLVSDFVNNLNAAALNFETFQADMLAFTTAFFTAANENNAFVTAINALEPNAQSTQASLFAADSIFNFFDEFAE